MDYRDAPPLIRDFLIYHETIKGHSKKTVDEYALDLRTFFRYIKQARGLSGNAEFLDIDIADVDIKLIASVTLTDIYQFMTFLGRDREYGHDNSKIGISTTSVSRKVSSLRSFFGYLTQKAEVLDKDPTINLDSPKLKKPLPRYLNVEQSIDLLNSVDGKNRERDYLILVLFLNCGLRISELVGLNLSDISKDGLRVRGKGNKERIIFLNDACTNALNEYMPIRNSMPAIEATSRNALLVTRQNKRISTNTVHVLVKKYLSRAGLDASQYSAHKLRHTAATLMHQNGVDIRTLQEFLGHDNLNTTEIYTHVVNKEVRDAVMANPLGNVKNRKSE